jgi:hypothetical protein
MAGLDAAIHDGANRSAEDMDARVKPGMTSRP